MQKLTQHPMIRGGFMLVALALIVVSINFFLCPTRRCSRWRHWDRDFNARGVWRAIRLDDIDRQCADVSAGVGVFRPRHDQAYFDRESVVTSDARRDATSQNC